MKDAASVRSEGEHSMAAAGPGGFSPSETNCRSRKGSWSHVTQAQPLRAARGRLDPALCREGGLPEMNKGDAEGAGRIGSLGSGKAAAKRASGQGVLVPVGLGRG